MGKAYGEGIITELKPQLNLTPDQEKTIRKAFVKKFTEESDQYIAVLLRLMLNGMPLPPEIPEPHLQTDRETLKPLLSEQQLASYDEFKAKDRKQRAAKTAEERLDELDSPLGLNEPQKNQIREIFAESAECQAKAIEDYDFAALSNCSSETKALAGVLTPTQFERYKSLKPLQPQQSRHWWWAFASFPPVGVRR